MTTLTISSGSAIPVVTATTSRLVNILEKFIVPVVAVTAGFIAGRPLAYELGTFMYEIVPGVATMENWMYQAAGDRGTVSLSIPLVLAGVVLMSSSVLADRLVATFLGMGRVVMLLRRGVVAFLFGVGIRAIAEGFAPFKGAVEAFSTTTTPTGTTTTETPPADVYVPTPTPLDDVVPTPTPLPTPLGNGGGDGSYTPIPGGGGEGRAIIIGPGKFGLTPVQPPPADGGRRGMKVI